MLSGRVDRGLATSRQGQAHDLLPDHDMHYVFSERGMSITTCATFLLLKRLGVATTLAVTVDSTE